MEQFKCISSNENFMMSLYKKVEKRIYKFGDVIHEEGKVPYCFYMIKKGQC